MRPSRISLAVLAAAVLAACQTDTAQQTPTISVAEAKKTVADFEQNKTLRPPRRTDDVLALFDNWPDGYCIITLYPSGRFWYARRAPGDVFVEQVPYHHFGQGISYASS